MGAAWNLQVKKGQQLNDFLVHHLFAWEFNLSRAPWRGGQVECIVGLAKAAMRKTVGNARLAFNELKEVILDEQQVVTL